MTTPFRDLYEDLQLSPNASAETVERVYRLLAKRYHPDNQDTGNAQKFAEVHAAYELLMDPERRAAYDVTYGQFRTDTWRVFDQRSADDDRESDRQIFQGILSLLYAARRQNPLQGGLGSVSLEKTLGCPREHLEFPLWYLKARGWIETLDTGQYAITVDGIDKVTSRDFEMSADRLLPESTAEGHSGPRDQRRHLSRHVS
jgi:curved DNA-binding protein CbpA